MIKSETEINNSNSIKEKMRRAKFQIASKGKNVNSHLPWGVITWSRIKVQLEFFYSSNSDFFRKEPTERERSD